MTGTDAEDGAAPLVAGEEALMEAATDDSTPRDPFEAVALVERKLKAQIGLVAVARRSDLSVAELHQTLTELKGVTSAILDDLDRVIPTLLVNGPTDRAPQPDLFTRLTQLCAGFRATSDIECVLAVLPRHLRFDTAATEILARAVRELLANVRQHSKARRVEISSTVDATGALAIIVKDDGIGLASGTHDRVSALESGAVGLSSIELRLREIGGHLELESSGGVCARLVLPRHSVAAHAPRLAEL